MNKNYVSRKMTIGVLAVAYSLLSASTEIGQTLVAPSSLETVTGPKVIAAVSSSVARYADQQTGMTVDQAVIYASEHNDELEAARKEIDAAGGLVRQAELRANPKVDASYAKTIFGTDNTVSLQGMLPLELGGRRSTRIKVAEHELEVRRLDVANRERLLSAEVRTKFGEALAAILKLGFAQDLIDTSQRGYNLVVARVTEGGTAPLEQNMVLVELNRLRSMRETAEGKTQIALLELRNLLGMTPEEPLRLRGTFDDLITPLTPVVAATDLALVERPDLKLAKEVETLSEARIEQARAAGRLDASLTTGYQRMDSSFPLNGINDAGQLIPIRSAFNYLTVGISIDLPVRNKNQGAIEASIAEAEATKHRRQFLELTIRREVASAFAQYNSAARAAEIFRVGVKDQANANLNIVRQTYELGSKTLIDYLGEERRYIELQNGYIDALLDTYKARVEVERVVATPTPNRQQVTQK